MSTTLRWILLGLAALVLARVAIFGWRLRGAAEHLKDASTRPGAPRELLRTARFRRLLAWILLAVVVGQLVDFAFDP